MLRVWLSVVGCAKMTYGDVCDNPSNYADTSAQICGESEKVHGAEADRVQLVLKMKACSQAHQSFMYVRQRRSFPKSGQWSRRGEPRSVSPRREIEALNSTPVRSNCAVSCVDMASNDVDAQAVCGKNSKKKTSTLGPRASPQLTLETHTHPCDRSMDVGTCLPDNSIASVPVMLRPPKSVPKH